jgi:hypothetical protein
VTLSREISFGKFNGTISTQIINLELPHKYLLKNGASHMMPGLNRVC